MRSAPLPEYPNYAAFVASLVSRDNLLLQVSIFAASVPFAVVVARYVMPRRVIPLLITALVILVYASMVLSILEYYR